MAVCTEVRWGFPALILAVSVYVVSLAVVSVQATETNATCQS